jgi:hypothetical protein
MSRRADWSWACGRWHTWRLTILKRHERSQSISLQSRKVSSDGRCSVRVRSWFASDRSIFCYELVDLRHKTGERAQP